MNTIAALAVLFVALLHFAFLVLESILWTRPAGRRIFGLTPELAEATRSLAMNQGLYNGFLAAGLIWGLLEGADGFRIAAFFLGCVIIAGVFGAITARRSILFIQALPGAIALLLLILAHAQGGTY
jgi:putative membrane protein